MFSSIYNRLFYVKDQEGWVFLSLLFTVGTFFVTVIGGFMVVDCPDNGVTTMPAVSATMLSFLPFAILLLLIPLYDNIIDYVIQDVTEKDVSKPYLIGSLLFGENYGKNLKYDDRYEYMSVKSYGYPTRAAAILLCLILPIQVFLIVISFPAMIPWTVGVVSIIALVFGVLRAARMAYRVSKRLTNHINDPNAHKE